MSKLLLLPMPGNEAFAAQLAKHIDAEVGSLIARSFPDGESYVRIESDVAGRQVAIVCTLRDPDPQLLRLVFAAREVKNLGATRVGLIAPYLAYMRQDSRFKVGEALSCEYFAALLSACFSWLVTVDPHLHRVQDLAQIYTLENVVVHAAANLGAWIRDNIKQPRLIGPDEESRQWVSAVAETAGADFVVLKKERFGDRDVRIVLPDMQHWRDVTPVLVDDIISSAHTMIAVLKQWPTTHSLRPVCVAVHAVFGDGAYEALLAANPARVVTTNAIPHETNLIDIAEVVGEAVGRIVNAIG